MGAKKGRRTCTGPGVRKLSDIIIEIGKVGFKPPFRELDPSPETGHILMLLATQAWNREVAGGQRHAGFNPPGHTLEAMIGEMLQKLSVTREELEQQLISTDWETIIEMMRLYKRKHFAGDKRRILAAGYTPRETLQVIWE